MNLIGCFYDFLRVDIFLKFSIADKVENYKRTGDKNMPIKNVHVLPNTNQGGWNVKKSGAQRASVHTKTKNEAVKIGRVISQRSESELIIHGQNGKIQRTDSHGHDSFPKNDKRL